MDSLLLVCARASGFARAWLSLAPHDWHVAWPIIPSHPEKKARRVHVVLPRESPLSKLQNSRRAENA